MGILKVTLVIGVLGAFALIVSLMIRYERRRHQDRKRIGETFGFHRIEELDEKTSSRLIHLHQHTDSQDLVVQHVSEQMEGSTRLVLFDLVDTSGDSNSTLVDAGIAVFSPALSLPRFSMIPRVAEKGRLAEISNSLLEMLIGKRSNRIQLNQNKYFEERYFLLGDDVPAIEGFLDEYRQSRLSQFAYRHLEADADCFTYSRFVFATRGKRNARADLNQDISEARNLLALFSN